MVISLNEDDIRRIMIESLLDLGLMTAEQIADIEFVDVVSKTEILNRKASLIIEEIIQT